MTAPRRTADQRRGVARKAAALIAGGASQREAASALGVSMRGLQGYLAEFASDVAAVQIADTLARRLGGDREPIDRRQRRKTGERRAAKRTKRLQTPIERLG